jgi:hypothetical protein
MISYINLSINENGRVKYKVNKDVSSKNFHGFAMSTLKLKYRNCMMHYSPLFIGDFPLL